VFSVDSIKLFAAPTSAAASTQTQHHSSEYNVA